MDCPYCKEDLFKLENFDNIYKYHECPSCKNQVWLDYEEDYIEETGDCWEYWNWLKEEKY